MGKQGAVKNQQKLRAIFIAAVFLESEKILKIQQPYRKFQI
jgi:hypothetical protein